MTKSKRLRHRVVVAAAVIATLLCWYEFNPRQPVAVTPRLLNDANAAPQLPCRSLPGANETLVVIRTGSTELQERFSIHLSTTLRCYPNHLIFSDYEEDYHGEHIIDALESVDSEVLANHADFALYRRLKDHGRAGLQPWELSGSDSQAIQGVGKDENPGWKLDKWKFLPMVNRTFYGYPDVKWYVFVEPDTYILWSSLLTYLSALGHTKPHYTGSQMFIDGVIFAHGGSGFVVSKPAMQLFVDHYAAHKRELEDFTSGHWAGDCVLGKALVEAGVPFTDAWPIMQGDYPGIVPYARPDGRPIADPNKRVWCYPTVSYHHLSPDVVEDLWQFEQHWIASQDARESGSFLRHMDVFKQYVMPRMSAAPRGDWDNESDNDEGNVDSVEACMAKCESNPDCKQYALHDGGICMTRVDPRLGRAAKTVSSGWLRDRMLQFERNMPPCGNEGWLM
ncbi:hypothetical protein LTR37_014484 [Vermiconidia calcicola]|uniref:Uncharacterized protein n=1 Tax=Vermiconidia calcicola TaxID=1690605 RepID=A0ACC3MTF1_9PEZI|nr:hypothetical protein LTR37_014484 [Vermiconidia calcicola]